ncbi:hypothetical protein [Paraliomyxa miuraensis]|uniref:hypothetical protein n=1 Tax=Paraliomyxa miuraensis TaxID=376150 RepID=UPI00225BFA95|nr:hypothetical protein [Paraliomyxa miuraensis]MCX4241077.1 hypothetical protein [Paraliomyxa miuraensis]
MDFASYYAQLIRSRLLHFAAWSPVTDPYEVGDYGALRGGVFHKLGNIREFGVEPRARPGASSVSLSFTSAGATMVRTMGGVRVDAFPAQAVEGTLELALEGESSVFIRTGKLSMTELLGVDAVAGQLVRRRDAGGRKWRLGWRVVRKVYVAVDPVILVSTERGARFSLRGRVDALAAVEAGRGSAELSVSCSKADSLQIVGGTGPVALDLFRVRIGGHAQVSFGAVEPQFGGDAPELGEPELDDEWEDEIPEDEAELFEPAADASS